MSDTPTSVSDACDAPHCDPTLCPYARSCFGAEYEFPVEATEPAEPHDAPVGVSVLQGNGAIAL